MKRRDFMIGAVAATGLMAGRRGWAQAASEPAKLSRVAIMSYGLNAIIRTNQPSSPERTLEIMDIGQLCADRFRVHNVTLQSSYFPSTDMSWLKDFKSRMAATKTRIVQINVELGTGLNMGTAAQSSRLSMLDLHRLWMDRAVFLECPRILVNQGQPTMENKDLTIMNYRAVAAIAKEKGLNVSTETRGGSGSSAKPAPSGPPSPPAYVLLTEIMKASGTSACVDFLNFPSQEEQLAGIRSMLPFTSGLVHAGIRYDLAPAMAVCRELRYTGLYAIKAAGLEGDPVANSQKIIEGVLANM